MNIRYLKPLFLYASLSLVPLLFFSACEISGGSETVREVSIRVEGSYVNESGIPRNQSGDRITLLAVSQSGDRLNAVDNLGARWNGSIGRAGSNVASVTLNGLTNNGVRVVITGTITVNGTSARLTGTWVEPGLSSSVSAQATVAAAPEPTPEPDPDPDPDPEPTPVPTNGTPDPDDIPDVVITP